MVTFKAEVYAHQKRKDGTYNIKIRITHRKKKRYIATPYYITKDDVTRSMKIKNQKYIDMTDILIRQYRMRCDGLGTRISDMDLDEIIAHIKCDREDRFDLDFISYARAYISYLQDTGHEGNANIYKIAVNSLVRYIGREQMSVFEITVSFLAGWVDWLQRGSSTPTYSANNYPSKIRAIYNRAKLEYNDEDAGVIRIPNSPFSHFHIPSVPAPKKRALDADKLRRLIGTEYEGVTHSGHNLFNFAKDIFILSFALVGMNAIDLYNCTDYRDGRITYKRTKTKNRRKDEAEISIKVEPEIRMLIEKYRDRTGRRVFRFYKDYGSMDAFSQALNKGLKRIGAVIGEESLQFYAARHTWATLAVNDVGIDKYTVHQALNHVDDTMRVTDTYIKRSWKPIDAANRKVLDYVNIGVLDLEEKRK